MTLKTVICNKGQTPRMKTENYLQLFFSNNVNI